MYCTSPHGFPLQHFLLIWIGFLLCFSLCSFPSHCCDFPLYLFHCYASHSMLHLLLTARLFLLYLAPFLYLSSVVYLSVCCNFVFPFFRSLCGLPFCLFLPWHLSLSLQSAWSSLSVSCSRGFSPVFFGSMCSSLSLVPVPSHSVIPTLTPL
jgi:hypothetical protein